MRTSIEDSAQAESAPKQAWSRPVLVIQSIAEITQRGNATACDGPFSGNRGRRCTMF